MIAPMQRAPWVDSKRASMPVYLGFDSKGTSSWRFSQVPSRGLAIREAGADGLGVFATHDVTPGERLLAERPLLSWRGKAHEPLAAAVAALAPAARRTFWALCQNAEHGVAKTAFGVWISNALPTEDAPPTAAVFRVASRFNHSCSPNAHISWNARAQRITVHALRRLAAGDEVRVDYRGDDGEGRAERQAALLKDFGFACRCSLCSLGSAARQLSDGRRARITHLGERIGETPCPRDLVEIVKERLRLMAEEEMLGTAWDTYAAASDYLRCTGELEGAVTWARRAATCAEQALGRDSAEWLLYDARARRPERKS